MNTITDEQPFADESPRSVTHLSDYQHRRDLRSFRNGAQEDLVPIAAVLDERRLSAMAAHPSNWRQSEKLREDPMLGEERI